MLSNVAFQVGQTLSMSVSPSFRGAASTPRTGSLKQVFGLPLRLVRLVAEARRQRRLDEQLAALSDSMLNDLGLERSQFVGQRDAHCFSDGVHDPRLLLPFRK